MQIASFTSLLAGLTSVESASCPVLMSSTIGMETIVPKWRPRPRKSEGSSPVMSRPAKSSSCRRFDLPTVRCDMGGPRCA